MEGLVECDANYVSLTPISFLHRAAKLHPNKTSMIYRHVTFTWKTTHIRCMKIASSLSSLALHYGDIVAIVAPNIPELYELHFAVPMAGGVLSPLNPRLDATTLSLILEELDPKFIFLYEPLIEIIIKALELLEKKITKIPFLILISTNHENEAPTSSSSYTEQPPSRSLHYDELLDMSHLDFEPLWRPKHECDPILVSYTSGSTGKPKGVIYSHRSTYLNTLGEVLRSDLREGVVFLWTADMFRANGWGFIWAIVALGGTNVCLRNITGASILDSISMHGITHLSGHPSILLTILENEDKGNVVLLPHKVYAHIAGILPSHETLVKIQEMGFIVVHRYGMTEVLGPPLKKLWKLDDDDDNGGGDGVVIAPSSASDSPTDNIMEEFDVKDPNTMESVPCDGKTIGEIMFRGNTLMMGYLKAHKETQKVFKDGWFHTGDLAVRHFDGRIRVKDRAKDLIVYKGECISTLEIEAVLLGHPKVLQVAVVGMPYGDGSKDDYEAPCAFVKLKIGLEANAEEIIEFCSTKLPIHMIPKFVIFGDLAVSSTGKVQKYVLKKIAKDSPNMLHS